jgi:hypothetical protein
MFGSVLTTKYFSRKLVDLGEEAQECIVQRPTSILSCSEILSVDTRRFSRDYKRCLLRKASSQSEEDSIKLTPCLSKRALDVRSSIECDLRDKTPVQSSVGEVQRLSTPEKQISQVLEHDIKGLVTPSRVA